MREVACKERLHVECDSPSLGQARFQVFENSPSLELDAPPWLCACATARGGGGGRRASYGITATLFWLGIRTVDGTGMNFNLGDVVISGLKEGWSGHCLDEWSSE